MVPATFQSLITCCCFLVAVAVCYVEAFVHVAKVHSDQFPPRTGQNLLLSSKDVRQISLLFETPSDRDDIIGSEVNEGGRTARYDTGKSLQILGLAVSLFFVAAVMASEGRLFAPPPPPSTSPNRERTVIDADALLREDFEKVSSSVDFNY